MEEHQEETKAEVDDAGSGKKRVAERQMRKEEDGEDDVQDEDTGTFRKADEKTIAQRRKVKVRRGNEPIPQNVDEKPQEYPTFNFGAFPVLANGSKEEKKPEESKEEKKAEESKEASSPQKKEDSKPTQSVPSLFSSTFTAPSASGLSFQTSFTFNSTNSPPGFSLPSFASIYAQTAGIFGQNIAKPSAIPSGPEVPIVAAEGSPSKVPLPSEPVTSGEEGEQHVYQTRVKLHILELGTTEWKERGVGVLKLNVAADKSFARLIMRVEGSLRLVMNVALWPALKIEKVAEKMVRFTAPHLEKPGEPCGYLLRVGSPSVVGELISIVDTHKSAVKVGSPTKATEEKKGTTSEETKSTTSEQKEGADSKSVE